MKSDIQIARSIRLKPIQKVAALLGLKEKNLLPYGRNKAKLPLSLIKKSKVNKSKLILVTAISPTPAGEGKTTMSQ